jgi:imidazolonepropionase-like amidohydrolase
LINCHTHLFLDASPDPLAAIRRDPLPYQTLQAARRAGEMLRAGITTARDMGGVGHADIALKRAIADGVAQGSRLLVCGNCIVMTGGTDWLFGREADGADEVRKATREQIKAGADVVKLMATGGVMTPGVEPGAAQFTFEELQAGVEEAHKAGRRTASHAQGATGVKNALRAGSDSIEHGIYLNEGAIDLFLKTGAYLVPTLAAPHFILKSGLAAGIPAYAVEKTQRVAETHFRSVEMAHRAGVKLAAGSDAGTPLNPHADFVTELELMVGVGLTPMEALTCATRAAADLLGLRDVGTIEADRRADLIVLEQDPLSDISALRHVNLVFKEGKRVQ